MISEWKLTMQPTGDGQRLWKTRHGRCPMRSELDSTSRDSAIPLAARRVLPGVIVSIMVVSALAPISDPDTFWHMATGDYLRATWTFSGPDPWSTRSTRTWRLHEWLPELAMSWAQQLGGLPAVAWLLPLGAAAILLILWVTLREHASLLITALVMTCTFIAMSSSFSLRPHLVTFALTILVTAAWLRTASDLRPRWWLVPLSWAWACSHGMWFVGAAIGFVIVVGMVCDGSVNARRGLRLALVPLASVAVAAVTPVGPALLLSPFEVRGYTHFVQEWLPPSLGNPGFLAFLVLSAACLVPWLRAGVRVPWTRILLAALATGLALAYIRTVPVAAAIMAPLAAISLQSVSGLRREPLGRPEAVATLALATAGLVLVGALSPARASLPSAGANELSPALDRLSAGTVIPAMSTAWVAGSSGSTRTFDPP